MITPSTGAKKIENTDNWREIFDAHNDSVDAEDKLAQDTAPIVNGNKSTTGASAGEYVLVRNSSITGITDGAYKAAQAIPANTAIDSTYLTAITGGIVNDLNSKLGYEDITSICTWKSSRSSSSGRYVIDIKAIHCVLIRFQSNKANVTTGGDTIVTLPSGYNMMNTQITSVACDSNGDALIDTKGAKFVAEGTTVTCRNPNNPTAYVYCSMLVPYT